MLGERGIEVGVGAPEKVVNMDGVARSVSSLSYISERVLKTGAEGRACLHRRGAELEYMSW